MPDPAEVFLRTERISLRRLVPADADHLHRLDSDPAVMRYLTNGVPTPYRVIVEEHLPALLAVYQRSTRHGRWLATDRATGEFLGWFALDPSDRPDEGELGYRLRRAVWGRGLATEGARALVRQAFTEFGLRRVYAQTMAVNTGSRRVLEKAGLRHVQTRHLTFDDPIPGTELGEVVYALTRAEWAATGGGAG